MQPHAQPRTYRIRLYDGHMEVNRNRPDVAVLDFSPGPGLLATKGQLDGLVQALAYAAGARGPKTLAYYLAIHNELTGELECTWPATTWLEA